jgi:hypothetical protein
MQTPRRSGQPIRAGDFVFSTTFSRPIRTSCENVGTVLPSFAREYFSLLAFFATHIYAYRKTRKEDARLSQARSKTARELTSVLKGNCESGEQQARNSVRTPEG